MIDDELMLSRKLNIKDTSRFDLNKAYYNWLKEFYSLFGKHAPHQLKSLIKKTIIMWAKDEHTLFTILAKDYFEKKYHCPKCGFYGEFTPTRHKKIEKMLVKNKAVICENPRTASCQKCSFTFNPLSISWYSNMKIDLRTIAFYMFISDDFNIDYPVSSIARILNVTYGTAKRMKDSAKRGYYNQSPEQKAESFFKKHTKESNITKVITQMADHKFLPQPIL